MDSSTPCYFNDHGGFGWYNTRSYNASDSSTFGQISDGPDSPGNPSAKTSLTFGHPTKFGFYIDPNGRASQRMCTEHVLNTHDDYQVTIWRVNGSNNDYILGWEDLDLNGSTGGDRDYQDMILSVKIDAVPEPATVLLICGGLIGLAGIRRKLNL